MPKVDDKRKEYDVLGLETTANEVDIKKAFTKLALKYHPDQHTKNCGQESHQYSKTKFTEVCRAYKKVMTEDNCNLSDWNNDKSDEIFFSLLGELLQNSTRASELYTLLSSQANSKPQFQNDNEYRCKEDAMEDEDEESELNKLVDILKNRLQNGKSVPAGLTQEKLTRLKDDFIKQKEENRKTEECHHTPTKKAKTVAPVPVAKPKPKNKKQLQAEQRRRELEMASIAKELEEKKKKDEEKEQVRKKQEKERKKLLEEEARKQEEDKKKQLNENRKKKEREEKEREQRSQKEKERQERLKNSQEEEQRKKEEEKRRKAEEKAAKQKSTKEKEEREKVEKQAPKNQNKLRSQQYQQYQQQQQKYPREVPPRFLRQQQMKLVPRKDQDYSYDNSNSYKEESGWTETAPDTQTDNNVTSENWDLDIDNNANNPVADQNTKTDTYWGGVPASENWDLDLNKPATRSSVTDSRYEHPAAPSSTSPLLNGTATLTNGTSEPSWGASLTGSTWDSSNVASKQWDVVKQQNGQNSSTSNSVVDERTQSSYAKNFHNSVNSSTQLSDSTTPWNRISSKPIIVESTKPTDTLKSASPGITPWAGLDSFDGGPSPINSTQISNNIYTGGAKPRTTPESSFHSHHSDNSEKAKSQNVTRAKETNVDLPNERFVTSEKAEKRVTVPSLDNKIDSNLKVTGWLQNSTTSENWDEEEKYHDGEFGWTTVSMKTKKPGLSNNQPSSTPGTPSKGDGCNAWTNRALKQLLDMGFKREQAERALRDNNGIIESAVSDLLLRGDSTETSQLPPAEQKPASKSETSNDAHRTTPQKLNRKQRRKLQQMQNAEQKESAAASNDTTTTSDSVAKSGDGLLPTPPASHRLVLNEAMNSGQAVDKTISRPASLQSSTNESNSAQKPTGGPQRQHSELRNSSQEVTKGSVTHAPIGSSRPSGPAPIQPPTPIQPPNAQVSQSSTSTTKESIDQMNGTNLQPPVNPVYLAQMHLQKLGLEDAPSVPPYSSSASPVPSQAVTNTMIQRYLQQIAQAPEVESSPSVSASMHLSGLLQQAPVPANSLSEGPQKSKLLQWTQTSSANNSEPTTPPSADEKAFPAVQRVDPVSAKWGVLAAPRLSPTPAEFKPGVPWRSRGEPGEDKDDEIYDTRTADILAELDIQSRLPSSSPPAVMAQPQANVTETAVSQTSAVTAPGNEESVSVRPPPGLDTASGEVKQDSNWLILKGVTSAVDPSPIRSLCQQFGTLLHFRVVANAVYVCYETPTQAQNAWVAFNGKVVFNTQVIAEVSTESVCMKAMESASLINNVPVATTPLTNHVSQPPLAPGFSNMSSFGGLWTTPGQPVTAPTAPRPLFPQTFPASYGVPGSVVNGGFNHWGLPPQQQPVMTNASQLWNPAPQQPSTVFQAYPGWVTTKQEIPVQTNMFSPGMDRCIPSELFNVKEQSS